MSNIELIEKLEREKKLEYEEWYQLIETYTEEDRKYAENKSQKIAKSIFGNRIYIRGIIEFTNICKNNCYYCGIRCSNENVSRYRLTKEEILLCCDEGYKIGYRTFVLQGGEDKYYHEDRLIDIVKSIREAYSDCAITLSFGELSKEFYKKLYDAGANRYLLRHETADEIHYGKLHPQKMSYSNRMRCLKELKEIGYQTGCGMMIGSPFQTTDNLVKDMMFLNEFKPEMIGIGPFIAHKDTPFRYYNNGSEKLTLLILSLCRIMQPEVLLPSTTALGTVSDDGRKLGVLAGCNVIMPNLSPLGVRKKYLLYNNKVGVNDDAEKGIKKIHEQLKEIGYEIYISRGDYKIMEDK